MCGVRFGIMQFMSKDSVPKFSVSLQQRIGYIRSSQQTCLKYHQVHGVFSWTENRQLPAGFTRLVHLV